MFDPKTLRGIIPPTVTPFTDETQELDERRLAREVRFLLDAGVHGLSVGGSTGEGALLSDAELGQGIRLARRATGPHLPLLCGIIRNSSRQAISASRTAAEAGADVLMVTPTFYHGTSEAGNFAYFQDIAAAVRMPIVIYNVIKDNPISPESMARISGIPEVIGIKQSVGGIHGLTDMVAVCGDKTLVFGAQDDLLYIDYELGAVGAISAILSVFPALCVEQWNAVRAGDMRRARDIHYRMLPVWRKIEGRAFPGKIKAALNLLGRDVGAARRPILPPTDAEIEDLRRAMVASGFVR